MTLSEGGFAASPLPGGCPCLGGSGCGLLLASSGLRPGMLLSSLQFSGPNAPPPLLTLTCNKDFQKLLCQPHSVLGRHNSPTTQTPVSGHWGSPCVHRFRHHFPIISIQEKDTIKIPFVFVFLKKKTFIRVFWGGVEAEGTTYIQSVCLSKREQKIQTSQNHFQNPNSKTCTLNTWMFLRGCRQ